MVGFSGKNEKLLSFMSKQVLHLKQATSPVGWLLPVKEEHRGGKDGCGSPCRFMGHASACSFPYGGKFPFDRRCCSTLGAPVAGVWPPVWVLEVDDF